MNPSDLDWRTLDRASRLLGAPVTFIAVVTGGEHARTLLAETATGLRVVVRRLPSGDDAGQRETALAWNLSPLGSLVPRLLGSDTDDEDGWVLVTEYVESQACLDLGDEALAEQLGAALAMIHRLDGTGLRRVPDGPPTGDGPVAALARRTFPHLHHGELVLTHYDFWVGNTLWRDGQLSAVVDWSGARRGPRAVDLAWLRLDLILQGREAAADRVVSHYERHSRQRLHDMPAWDLQAAAQAESVVETWAPNYQGIIGLAHLTPQLLRARFDHWARELTEAT